MPLSAWGATDHGAFRQVVPMSVERCPGSATLTLMAGDAMATGDAGFWRSSNPTWGAVRAVVTNDEYAIVLDDLNRNYREVELSVYRRTGGGWEDLFSLDDQGFPDEGSTVGGRGGYLMGFEGRYYSVIYGHESPRAAIHLAVGEARVDVVADANGWWLHVVRDEDMRLILRRVS